MTTLYPELMQKIAKKKTPAAIEHAGKVDPERKTYPISRFLTSPQGGAVRGALSAVGGGPVTMLGSAAMGAAGQVPARAMDARAARGRARLGRKGVFTSDDQVIKALRAAGEKVTKGDSRTFPISRFFTSPEVSAGIGSLLGVGATASQLPLLKFKTKGGALAALLASGIIGGGMGGGTMALYRAMTARGSKGRAAKRRRGLTESDRKVIQALIAAEKSKK
tara:strand:- start:8658 stop:9320 length:663 start_codon:yes stop_codon:yes gene_type:complete